MDKFRNRLLPAPKGSFFLFGCRGTGKSTWMRNAFPGATLISLLEEERYQKYLRQPGAFGNELRALAPGSRVLVDEIQRLPNLLNEVHRAIEQQGLVFVLCGSSARKLKRSGVNLLAGRAQERHLAPYMPPELGRDFNLEKALHVGTLPVIWESEEPTGHLEAYARMYLKEEIQAEALVRNLPAFSRFLPVAALMHGQTLNTASLARDAMVARTTVEGYLDILEETLVAFRVPGFEARLRVKERKHPKFYWVDPGMVCGILGQRTPPEGERRGALFEGLVAGVLKAARELEPGFADDLSYWCPGGTHALEVDFILTRGRERLAIEVKSGHGPRPEWTRGLSAITDLEGLVRRLVVCPDMDPQITPEGIEFLSFADFSAQVFEKRLWP